MAYPYSVLNAAKVDATVLASDHPAHHNAMANALNDILTELGTDPGGGIDVTTRLAGAEFTANKNAQAGYLGLDTGGAAGGNYLPPERRYSLSNRVASMFLAKSASTLVKDAFLTDSMGHTGSSAPETTSFPARYESEMARLYNRAPRTNGHCPIEMWTALGGVDTTGIAWDTVPAGGNVAHGGNYANKQITAAQSASNTRNGTAVTVFYTALRTGGAVLTVDLNGSGATTIAVASNGVNTSTFAGAGTLNVAAVPAMCPTAGTITVATGGTTAVVTYTGTTSTTFTGCTTVSGGGVMATGGAVNAAIDNRDGTVAASPGYNSGRSVTFGSPLLFTFGPLTITLTHSGIGTTAEVEGGYWHNQNVTDGLALYRLGRSGLKISDVINAANPAVYQWIANQQPQIVTVVLGCNDAQTGATAATMATNLNQLFVDIRAQYASTGMPCIRYVFQWKWTFDATNPATWLTDYRSQLRQVCVNNDVTFIDSHEATGQTTSSGSLTNTADGLHPDDTGHGVWGQMIGNYTRKPAWNRSTYLDLGILAWQSVTVLGTIALKATSSSGVQLFLYRDPSAAMSNNAQLGLISFGGAIAAGGYMSNQATGIRGVAEEAWSTTTQKAGLRFRTTAHNASIADTGGVTGDGVLYADAIAPSSKTRFIGADYATTAALPSCTYNNTTGRLTATANGALATQDTITPVAGDIILVKNQVSAFQNGVYVVTTLGDAGNPFVLTRHGALAAAGDLANGLAIFVSRGQPQMGNAGTVYSIAAGTYTLGTTSILPVEQARPNAPTPGEMWLGPERSFWRVWDDFERFDAANTTTSTHVYPGCQFWMFTSGAGTGITQVEGGTGEAITPHGVVAMDMGTTTTGKIAFNCSRIPFTFSSSKRYDAFFRCRTPTVSDGTETFSIKFGLMDGINSGLTTPTNGVYFQQRSATNYECVAMTGGTSNGTSPNGVDSGSVPATGYRTYRILCPGDGTALFYVNEVLAATVSTQLPDTVPLFAGLFAVKSAGTTSRTWNVDLASFSIGSPRTNMGAF